MTVLELIFDALILAALLLMLPTGANQRLVLAAAAIVFAVRLGLAITGGQL